VPPQGRQRELSPAQTHRDYGVSMTAVLVSALSNVFLHCISDLLELERVRSCVVFLTCSYLHFVATLMNLIAGRTNKGTQVGSITVNGVPMSQFKESVAFVTSHDVSIGEFTVMQSLYYSCKLRLAGILSDEECIQRCKDIAAAVGIESSLDTIIGTVLVKGISGGQMRRLSIGTELLALPEVLCLDEPTTGDASIVLLAVTVKNDHTRFGLVHFPATH
jgi:ABC-type taurine transport system ATPase subunit